jgi:RimJ/RimL family protein N-acetyltransferase
MTLHSERLHITSLLESDIEDIHEMVAHEEVGEFNTIGVPKILLETKKLFQPLLVEIMKPIPQKYFYVMRLKTTNDFVGDMGLTLGVEKYKKAEIHYSLHPKHWGHGYASEAVKAMVNFAFKELDLHRIEAGVAIENKRSITLLEKLGFEREGHHRKILPIRGQWVDNFSYAILVEDWKF